jgi:enolase
MFPPHMNYRIAQLAAWQILDSRGNPTVAVECRLESGVRATAMAPSGASTGRHEAVELRDPDGRGVGRAVAHVNREIQQALAGGDAREQAAIDRILIELDGTPDKSRLGANAILGASLAVARSAAQAAGLPLWQYLTGDRRPRLPVPMINILSGGLHAGRQLEFQDFLIIPEGCENLPAMLEAAVAIHRRAERLIREAGHVLTGVADEGGLGPRLASNREALELLARALPERGVTIALDVAATHFYRDGYYELEKQRLDALGMTEMLSEWLDRYPIVSIEDPLAEDDWEGWRDLTARLGGRCSLVGDDLFCTNLRRLERGIQEGAANSVLVKMNQIGTLTETFQVIDRAREAGYGAVISARSGETEDAFLADLAVASGAGQIKIGSVTRSERLSKYNRLLEIAAREWAG